MPVLVLAGERDTLIPPAHAQRLHEAWRGPKAYHELSGADHNSIAGHPDYVRLLSAFFAASALGGQLAPSQISR